MEFGQSCNTILLSRKIFEEEISVSTMRVLTVLNAPYRKSKMTAN